MRATISSLLQNKVDISELIITKQLNKTEENMKVMMAHVVLAKKMKDRDPNTAPVLGERIPYVIVTVGHVHLQLLGIWWLWRLLVGYRQWLYVRGCGCVICEQHSMEAE